MSRMFSAAEQGSRGTGCVRGHGDGLVPSGTAWGADGPSVPAAVFVLAEPTATRGWRSERSATAGTRCPPPRPRPRSAAASARASAAPCAEGSTGSRCTARSSRGREPGPCVSGRASGPGRDGCHGRAGPAACLAPFVTGVWSGKERRCLKGTMSICCGSGSWLLPRIAALLGAPEQGHVPGTLPQGCRRRGSCHQGGSSTVQSDCNRSTISAEKPHSTPFGIY